MCQETGGHCSQETRMHSKLGTSCIGLSGDYSTWIHIGAYSTKKKQEESTKEYEALVAQAQSMNVTDGSFEDEWSMNRVSLWRVSNSL